MAPSYLASIIVIVSQILPLIGINVAGDDLTTTVNTIIAIVGKRA